MAAERSAGIDEFSARLLAIEKALGEGRYRPGPWDAFVRAARNQPDDVRAALAADVSRVSRKLHLRTGRGTISFVAGVGIELASITVGAGLIAIGAGDRSGAAALAAMVIWTIAFQPVLKIVVGKAFGIGYDYAYLLGVEPRFKMSFGTYLAAPRGKRIAFHLSGMFGSPLGAMLAGLIVDGATPLASRICLAVAALMLALNLVLLVAALLGVHRMG
ncbi:MAG: hypothetical protein WA005_20015, partial [Candidatus Binataceae bacterium]